MTQLKYALYTALFLGSAITLTACVEKKEENKEVVQPVPVPGPEKIVPVPGPEKLVPVPTPAPEGNKSE